MEKIVYYWAIGTGEEKESISLSQARKDLEEQEALFHKGKQVGRFGVKKVIVSDKELS